MSPRWRRLPVLLMALAVLMPGQGLAHSGGLDSKGCHAGSQPYHCHRPQTAQPAQPPAAPRRSTGDLDCADFSSWRQAQDFFEQNGPRDPHRLDADKDGIACEHLN